MSAEEQLPRRDIRFLVEPIGVRPHPRLQESADAAVESTDERAEWRGIFSDAAAILLPAGFWPH